MPQTATAIHELLSAGCVRVGLPGATKREAVDALVDVLDGHADVKDLEEVREAIHAREEELSTGVGKGLGLPHAKTSAVSGTLAAFAVTEEPIDFDAIDGRPVRLLFLLVGTEAAKSEHIRILSRLSRLVSRQPLREALLAAQSPDDVIAAFADAEQALSR